MRAGDVVGGRVLQQPVNHAGVVKPGDHGQPTRDSGRTAPAHLLTPAHVQLDVDPSGLQRVQAVWTASVTLPNAVCVAVPER